MKQVVKFAFEGANIKNARCLHACSELEAGHIRTYGYSGPIAIINAGISKSELQYAQSLRHIDLTDQYQQLAGKRIILYLSRLHEQKGPHTLVDAWQRLFTQHPDWHLVISGSGDTSYVESLKKRIVDNKMHHSVTFPGPAYDIDKWEWLKMADLFILPSYSENFGLVVAESLAAGTPVITTKGTPWQALETENCGWWIDTGVKSLTSTLEVAITMNDSERRSMGLRGREYVIRELDWNRTSGKMVSVYEWILNGGTVPDCVRLD
jgi:glycosyltransferase involved in cell wall biosynthesis